MNRNSFSRRAFLQKTAGVVVAGPLVAPAIVRSQSLNETLHVASIGVGGYQGRYDLDNVAGAKHVEIVALCDIDSQFLGKAAEGYPAAKTFADYRRMFDVMQKDIDAVIVTTPDHMHGSIALATMGLGKHLYCQKPLAHNLSECRAMQQMAAKNRHLVTQMGTQIHSTKSNRAAVKKIQAGVIGKVSEVHAWIGRMWDGPPSGRPAHADPIPEHINWDLWLGVAPRRPFVKEIYHPAEWRRWTDFGTGSLGDMGCHIFDPIFSALGLRPPISVVSHGPACFKETYAPNTDMHFTFGATDLTAGDITLRWTDGTGPSLPDASRAQLPEGVELPGNGSFLVGEKGVMVLHHGGNPKLYRHGEEVSLNVEELSEINHYHEWADACRGEGLASTPFSYSCAVTESVLVGTIASRFPRRELRWDSKRLAFDDDEATALVRRHYRGGWEISGIFS